MADRIVVLSANPGRIRTVLDNALPRPRDPRSADFVRLVDRIHDTSLPPSCGRGDDHLSSVPAPPK